MDAEASETATTLKTTDIPVSDIAGWRKVCFWLVLWTVLIVVSCFASVVVVWFSGGK